MNTVNGFLIVALSLAMALPAGAQPSSGNTTKATQATGAAGSGKSTLRRSSRMEFDGRLVKGERAAGAVYLFQRAPRRLPPLLRLKRDQLDRIVLPVLKRPADPAQSATIAAPSASPKAVGAERRGKAKRSTREARRDRKSLRRGQKKRDRKSKRKRRTRKKNR